MSNILTHQEFATFKNISKKYDIDKVEQAISLAEIDLKEVLGNAFFFDVEKNIEKPQYSELLQGSEFSDNDFSMYHEGIKSLLTDYAYSRYLYELNINHTPFGLTGKNSNDSTPVDRNTIRDLVKQTQQDAASKWNVIKRFLDLNENFTIWHKQHSGCGIDNNSNGFNSTRFTFLSTGK